MKRVPFPMIQAAQDGDTEALNYIFKHFEGYIASRSLVYSEDDNGRRSSHVSDDLRYLATVALSNAIFKFRFREPPESFAP